MVVPASDLYQAGVDEDVDALNLAEVTLANSKKKIRLGANSEKSKSRVGLFWHAQTDPPSWVSGWAAFEPLRILKTLTVDSQKLKFSAVEYFSIISLAAFVPALVRLATGTITPTHLVRVLWKGSS